MVSGAGGLCIGSNGVLGGGGIPQLVGFGIFHGI